MVAHEPDDDARVAVYIDFDNIVISRYDQLWGRGRFHADRLRSFAPGSGDADGDGRVEQARVDIGAILDYAASYGTTVATRAYADWSMQVNAHYRQQLVGRAVDLVQLFPSTRGMKNGADIRLAVDVVEDLFRLPDLTHVVIVAGDSDYIALAQRAKRLGRFVVGIGVAGSTSRSLAAACDEFADYDALPGVAALASPEAGANGAGRASQSDRARSKQRRASELAVSDQDGDDEVDDAPDAATQARDLLARALRVSTAKADGDWVHANVAKEQMKRMDPSFHEKSLGYRSFTDFVAAQELAEVREDGQARLIRLRDTA